MALAHVTPSPDDADDLGELIRQARERRGWRQTDLAAAIHAGSSAPSAWERGLHIPSAEMILALAEALHVRFVADVDGRWRLEDPDTPPSSPTTVVVVVAGPEEAVEVVQRIQRGLGPS